MKSTLIGLLLIAATFFTAAAFAQEDPRLSQCLDLCGDDHICIKNCKKALAGTGGDEEEEEDCE